MFVETFEAKDLVRRFLRVNVWCYSCGEPAERVQLKQREAGMQWTNLRPCCSRCARREERQERNDG